MSKKKIQNEKEDNAIGWIWEFSKKLVVICSLLYIFGFFYACIVMWKFFDFTYLGTFIEQSSDMLRTCVFSYFVKAGVENIIKIKCSADANEQTEQEKNNAVIPPDGE